MPILCDNGMDQTCEVGAQMESGSCMIEWLCACSTSNDFGIIASWILGLGKHSVQLLDIMKVVNYNVM